MVTSAEKATDKNKEKLHVVWQHQIEGETHLDVQAPLTQAKTLWLVAKPVNASLDSFGDTKAEQSASDPSDDQGLIKAKKGSFKFSLEEPRLETLAGTKKLERLVPLYSIDNYMLPKAGEPLPEDDNSRIPRLKMSTFSVIAFSLDGLGAKEFRARLTLKKAPREKSEFLVLTDIPLRASLFASNNLQSSLGRPSRDQVITSRATAANTMGALALMQHHGLHEIIKRGGDKWSNSAQQLKIEKAKDLYETALGRTPYEAEYALIKDLLTSKNNSEAFEDLLWSVIMLPEFQLVF